MSSLHQATPHILGLGCVPSLRWGRLGGHSLARPLSFEYSWERDPPTRDCPIARENLFGGQPWGNLRPGPAQMENHKLKFLFSQFDKYLSSVCPVWTLSRDCGKMRKRGRGLS